MKHTLSLAVLCICMLVTSLGSSNRSAGAAPFAATQVGRIPVAQMLNSDGTLNLQKGVSGTVDLAGWRVSLDPRRGLVFAPDVPSSAAWSALSNGVNGLVSALAVSGNDVYVGGYFKQICGNAACDSGNVTVNNVAHWNGSAWSALGNGVNISVSALAVSGSAVYVGGTFTQICGNATCDSGNTTANHIAQWNGSAWSSLNSGVDNRVNALAVSGSDVYVGGNFIHVCGYLCLIGNNSVNHVARWDGNAWYALGSGVNGNVNALAVSGSDVYVGGAFTQVCGDYLCSSGNTSVNHVALWNGSAWSSLNSGVNGNVNAIAVSGRDVYVGGDFTQICGVAACNSGNSAVNYVAKWNGHTWYALGNGVDLYVRAIDVNGSGVYVGGPFTYICGNSTCNSNVIAHGIAKWSSASSAWSALGNGINGNVEVIGVSGSVLYVGGGFNLLCGDPTCLIGDEIVNHVARYSSLPSFNVFLPLTER